jgi:hypothetical protein
LKCISFYLGGSAPRVGAADALFAKEPFRRQEKWIVLQQAANNNQWASSNDVDEGITSKLKEVIGADPP